MSKQNIIIVDYGLGNLASIKNMIKKVGGQSEITSEVEKISNAGKIILPGVGSFGKGMENLKEKNLIDILTQKAFQDKVPFLGICLGMQLLTKHSEESNTAGLGWIDAQTVKFNFNDPALKVPHMSWSDIDIVQKNHPIFEGIETVQRYYFVHSYYVKCNDNANVLTQTSYGNTFHSGVISNNIIGFQFHPEKSHKFGMHLLKNFVFNL